MGFKIMRILRIRCGNRTREPNPRTEVEPRWTPTDPQGFFFIRIEKLDKSVVQSTRTEPGWIQGRTQVYNRGTAFLTLDPMSNLLDPCPNTLLTSCPDMSKQTWKAWVISMGKYIEFDYPQLDIELNLWKNQIKFVGKISTDNCTNCRRFFYLITNCLLPIDLTSKAN